MNYDFTIWKKCLVSPLFMHKCCSRDLRNLNENRGWKSRQFQRLPRRISTRFSDKNLNRIETVWQICSLVSGDVGHRRPFRAYLAAIRRIPFSETSQRLFHKPLDTDILNIVGRVDNTSRGSRVSANYDWQIPGKLGYSRLWKFFSPNGRIFHCFIRSIRLGLQTKIERIAVWIICLFRKEEYFA